MDKFELIKLLSDKNRFEIFMKLLEYDELCVSEIIEILDIKQANASKHIKKFKDLNMLDSYRNGSIIKYRIKTEFIDESTDLIKFLLI